MTTKTEPHCAVCGRGNDQADLRGPLPGWIQGFSLPKVICYDCLEVWYDEGETDPAVIREKVLGRHGGEGED